MDLKDKLHDVIIDKKPIKDVVNTHEEFQELSEAVHTLKKNALLGYGGADTMGGGMAGDTMMQNEDCEVKSHTHTLDEITDLKEKKKKELEKYEVLKTDINGQWSIEKGEMVSKPKPGPALDYAKFNKPHPTEGNAPTLDYSGKDPEWKHPVSKEEESADKMDDPTGTSGTTAGGGDI